MSGKRVIYVKDHGLSQSGFASHAEATLAADKMGERETPERRIRILLRQRTDTFDVVVKVRKEIEA